MTRRSVHPDREPSGFAFLETVIAAAILATMLGVTYQTVANGAQAAHLAEDRRQSILVAQSLLAQVGTSIPLAAGSVHGRDGDLVWQADIEAYGGGAREQGPPLFAVRVRVRRDGDARDLADLDSLRLAS